MKIERFLLEHKRKTITEKELNIIIGGNYDEVVVKVRQLADDNLLQPVIASKTNGRRPALYNRYHIIKPEKDYSEAIEQIKLLHPRFDHQAYFDNPELYLTHKNEIDALSNFLWRHSEELELPMSVNERSLRIWGREKLLKENLNLLRGALKFNDWTLNMLNFYETPEPFFEYMHRKDAKMNILVIENKDTWYTLRKIMTEQDNNMILNREYHVLLYGEGRKITRETGRLEEYDREMLAGGKNKYYYFGDLDYEGISIFMDLVNSNKNLDIKLCTELYCLMLSEVNAIELPETKDNRGKDVDVSAFTSFFVPEIGIKIERILKSGRYIPQEVLNYQVFIGLMKGK